MLWLTCRRVTAVFALFVLASQSVWADQVRVSQVIQTMNPNPGTVDLRVNNLAQDPVSPDVKGTGSAQAEKSKNSEVATSSSSTLTGLEITSQPQQIGVEVVGDAIVEGTVCDCGEILVPGAFPKWPLLFLAAIPLIFIHDCNDCDNECLTCDTIVTPTPSPTPPNSNIPEPATLFLFGTGLLAFGAGLRRRYAKSKLTVETRTADK